jgi:hypothetical protein
MEEMKRFDKLLRAHRCMRVRAGDLAALQEMVA